MRGALVAIACSAAVGIGCEQVDYIDIKPTQVVLKQPNNQVWLQAHPMSHTGVYYDRIKISWCVKDPAVAQVDGVGKVTPLKSGQTEVIAKVGEITASVPVQVLYAEKLEVEPQKLVLKSGQPAVEIQTRAYDYLGRELRDRTPIFKVLNAEVLSMGQNAAFPVGPGKTELQVSVDGLKKVIDVRVEK